MAPTNSRSNSNVRQNQAPNPNPNQGSRPPHVVRQGGAAHKSRGSNNTNAVVYSSSPARQMQGQSNNSKGKLPATTKPPRNSTPLNQNQNTPISMSKSAIVSAPKGPGMSPASRYEHNLRVLRRHDATIVSIFDQFSHVCVYHHDGTKWEKKGYEGSMFLFERCVVSFSLFSSPGG